METLTHKYPRINASRPSVGESRLKVVEEEKGKEEWGNTAGGPETDLPRGVEERKWS